MAPVPPPTQVSQAPNSGIFFGFNTPHLSISKCFSHVQHTPTSSPSPYSHLSHPKSPLWTSWQPPHWPSGSPIESIVHTAAGVVLKRTQVQLDSIANFIQGLLQPHCPGPACPSPCPMDRSLTDLFPSLRQNCDHPISWP